MECKRVMTGFLICTGLSISAFSQTTGKIIDTKQQPIEGATIVMQLPDSTYLGAAISAADGTFTLEQEPDGYLLIVQHLLYQTKQVKGQTADPITTESPVLPNLRKRKTLQSQKRLQRFLNPIQF